MNKREMLFVKTVISFLSVLSVVVPTTLYGEDTSIESSSSDPKKIEEKIDRGLSLALEAIMACGGYHTEVENIGHQNPAKTDNKEDGEYSDGDSDFNIEGDKHDRTYRQVNKVHNRLITEFGKILNEKNKMISQSPIPKPIHYTIRVEADRPWTRTGVSLKQNDIVRIYCKGKVMPGGFEMVYKNTSCLAEGYHFTRGNFTVLPDARYMAVIGKIGNRDAFYIGSEREFVSYVNGSLYLGINDLNKSIYTGEPINKRSVYWKDNSGYYEADIYVYRE
jgi:hypothetical protein